MKRIWLALVSVFALCFALTSCGGSSGTTLADFAGTWQIYKMTVDGEEIPTETIEAMREAGLDTYLDLESGGNAVLDLYGDRAGATWKATGGGKATLSFSGGDVSMVLDDQLLTVEFNSSTLVFKKIDPSEKLANNGGTTTPTSTDDVTSETDVTDLIEDTEEMSLSWGGDEISDLSDYTETNIVLVDDDSYVIKITAKGLYVGDPGFYFEVTNKTDSDAVIHAVSDTWNVSGKSYDPIILETIPAGQTLGTIGWFNADEVGSDVDALTGISGTIEFLDDDYHTIASYDVSF